NILLANLIGLNLVYQRESSDPPQVQNAGNLGDGIVLDGTNGVSSNSIGLPISLSSITGPVSPVLSIASSYISAATGNAVTSMPFPTTAGQSITGTAYLGNIIAANRGNGVNLENSASQNLIVANTIGATSSTPNGKPNLLVGNSGDGILITNSSGNTIG